MDIDAIRKIAYKETVDLALRHFDPPVYTQIIWNNQ